MREQDDLVEGMFSYIRLEDRVPLDHPLRAIRKLAHEALDGRFEAMYSVMGRPSIAPEMLLRATSLQAFFSVRSERQLMEQIDYNLLFRWFVGLPMDAAVWHPTVFSHNRDRLMAADVAREFLAALMGLSQVKALLSGEHFSVDGTLIDAWATMKSFTPKNGSGTPPGPGRNGERDFQGKSVPTKPMPAPPTLTRGFTGRPTGSGAGGVIWVEEDQGSVRGTDLPTTVLMENRNGLAVEATLTHATGTAEREAPLTRLDRRKANRRITLGADKAYDVTAFVGDLRARGVTPHIAVNGTVSKLGKVRKPAIDEQTISHPGYAISQLCRKRIEEVFGWIKAVAGFAGVKVRGRPNVDTTFTPAVAAYNLICIPKLLARPAT